MRRRRFKTKLPAVATFWTVLKVREDGSEEVLDTGISDSDVEALGNRRLAECGPGETVRLRKLFFD